VKKTLHDSIVEVIDNFDATERILHLFQEYCEGLTADPAGDERLSDFLKGWNGALYHIRESIGKELWDVMYGHGESVP
jgi:hypothetical protein